MGCSLTTADTRRTGLIWIPNGAIAPGCGSVIHDAEGREQNRAAGEGASRFADCRAEPHRCLN